ncbi:MAG: Loki-CTERM sorting domain-containing protein, partial [Candidatus Lokiarchaeota archaeon]|nr:Loki-CTERM sorting domain-containing protein [Candidatus Lokiarchaeota archaeon]
RRIPGYPLYLLLTFFIVITAIIIKKKCKKLP